LDTTVRLRGHGRLFAVLLGLFVAGTAVLPTGKVQASATLQTSDLLKVGPVVTIALDNVGGGWGWTGPARPSDDGHLIRLQDGAWRDVPRLDASWGALRNAAAIDKIVLSGDGKSGWAIGTGGGPNIWQLKNGAWLQAALPFEKDVLLLSLTANADASDGWITAQDKSLRYAVARLRNGQWVRDLQPVYGDMRFISLSPDGKSGWGVGPSRKDLSKYIAVRLDNGKWVDDAGKNFEVPFNSNVVTADNSGNGWVIGPPVNSVLIRMTKDGANQLLPNPRTENPFLYPGLELQEAAVNGVGRGWATGTYKPVPDPTSDKEPKNQPLLFRLDGDSFTVITSTAVPANSQATRPNYGGPIAFTPDGVHSWLAASTGEYAFIGLTELREPWQHDKPVAAAPLPGAGHCFAEVQYCLRGVFADYWDSRGGLYNMGFPITPEVEETINGTKYVVQYTQRARMEYHPEHAGTPYVVLLGLLGNVLSDPRHNEPPFMPTGAHANPGTDTIWFPLTQHNIGPPFLAYWNGNGGLPIFGYPRSEAFNEQNEADNNTYLVQYFERNRIEYHPENRGTRFEFLLGLLGVEQFKATYGYTP
jgi:hypothetical protein